MKPVWLGAAIFVGATMACIGHLTSRTEMRATEEVCQLVHDNYYRLDQTDVQSFLEHCATDSVPMTFSRSKTIQHLNAKLSRIQSSHLAVYSPEENRQLWENEGSDTGVRARMIEGEVVINATLDGSPARKAGLQPADVVVTINDERPTSVQDAQTTKGSYKIARGQKFFLTDLGLEDLKEDLSPKLIQVSNTTALLKIPSFLPVYFDPSDWMPIAKRLGTFKNVIIDLRGNPGGSFPAMLRALSPFRCDSREIGRIWRAPRKDRTPFTELRDDLSAEEQLKQINASNEVVLKTFGETYGCFQGRMIVLVDTWTASAAEVFAQAMIGHARIWGDLTAGQVVLARWFSIGSLGGGDFAMSIPIAGYRTASGEEIENAGVRPDKLLNYKLEDALKGDDTYLKAALQAF